MHKISILSLFLIAIFSSYCYEEKTLFMGKIQFPLSINIIPSIRVYYAGKKITTEIDEEGKRVLFSVPEQKNRTFFYLLVTPEIQFVSKENTIEYLKLKSHLPHKFYALELISSEEVQPNKRAKFSLTSLDNAAFAMATTTKHHWEIKELSLNILSGRIPDETIIICFDPSYVQKLEGGNIVEFPKIVLKPDLINILGSEKKLHELSTKWFLAALNTDTIHEPFSSEIKLSGQNKTIIAMAA
jgi:hypothetical protein